MERIARRRSRAPRTTAVRTTDLNRYQQIFEVAQAGLWTLDADDRISLVNRCMAEMLGYPIDEIVGQRALEFVHPEAHKVVERAMARRRRGVVEKYDLRFCRKDGTTMWAIVSASPILNRQGKYVGALALVSDITARKETEEELRRSEARFALLAKATKDVIYEWDLVTGRLWFNEGIREVFGYPDQSTDIQWWRDRVHPDDFDRASGKAAEMEAGRTDCASTEYRFRRADGTYADVYARGYIIRNAEGEAVRAVGAMMDLTERNKAQIAIAESQRRLQALFDNAMDAIFLMDDLGCFIDGNPSAAALVGYSLDEIKRLHFTDLTPPPSDAQAWHLWRDFQAAGRQTSEISIRRKDGTMIEIEYCAVGNIQPGIHLLMARDISERKRSEVNLAENQTRLQALTSRVVHAQEDERRRIARELHDEIGQTLTAVKIGLDAIQRTAPGSAATAKQIDETGGAVDLALQKIRDLSLGLRPLILDDLGLVATLRWYLDGQAQKSGMAIHFSSTLPLDRLCPDVESACFRIVQEGLTNVIRHSSAKGVWVSLQEESGRLLLTLKDNGRGFDPALMLNRSASNLGLIGMQERAKLLGGTIDIISAPGQGTEIRALFHCPRLMELQECASSSPKITA